MKVIVCFGNTRIVVPCGSGNISVQDLQEKACIRYRRAIGKDAGYAVRILKLESVSDGGILDIEDMVADVVEDKDKLIAVFEEEDPSHGEWEHGSAASSEGKSASHHSSHVATQLSSSNEFEQRYLSVEKHDSPNNYLKTRNSRETKSIYEAAIPDASTVIARDGSTSPMVYLSNNIHAVPINQNGASRMNGYDPNSLNPRETRSYIRSPNPVESSGVGNGFLKKRISSRDQPYFQRDSNALRQPIGSELNGTASIGEVYTTSSNNMANMTPLIIEHTSPHPMTSWLKENSHEIRFINDGNVETIMVRGHFDQRSDAFVGLLVESITQKFPSTYNGHLRSDDVIIAINGRLLLNYGFNDAEALLTQSLAYSEVLFRILTRHNEKQQFVQNSLQDTLSSLIAQDGSGSILALSPTSTDTNSSSKRISSDSASSSNQKQFPSAHRPLSLRNSANQSMKKSASQINVQLLKDHQGLGFSLTANDTTSGDLPGPLYVQEVLQSGAAMKSGKLAVGDKLLEINGISVLGKTQLDVVDELRAISTGSVVHLAVSRHVEHLPRKLNQALDVDHVTNNDHMKEYFTFDIALNDTGSAGLGIGLMGNQNTKTRQDLGVFVRSVFHGGAAWQDGRLKANDQLVEVNGHRLNGLSNQAAIAILRTSMSTEGNVRGMIQMMISRRKNSPDQSASRMSSDASSEMSDLFPENRRSLARSDSSPNLHVKQSSLPSQLLETSFGPDDISDVTSHGFNSFTLGRIRRGTKKSSFVAPYVAHSRSNSSTVETDTMDAGLVSQVHQKIFNSSSSSSSIIGNLLSSSLNSSSFNRAPPGIGNNSYSTWTIPRTNRVHKRTLSLRSTKTNTLESIVSALDDEEAASNLQRSEFDAITAGELGSTKAPGLTKKEATAKQHQSTESCQPKRQSDDRPNVPDKETENKRKSEQTSPAPTLQSNAKDVKLRKDEKRHIIPTSALLTSLRRSISTESLVTAMDKMAEQLERDKIALSRSKDVQEVGPCLGIAKSSSLESLQTAVESCIAEQNADPSIAKPLPKAVRGRVLNDSFRAALNRTYDLAEAMPLKKLETPSSNHVLENHNPSHLPIIKSNEDPASKAMKKKNRFFGLFKTSKTKKLDTSPPTSTKLTEKEEHKRNLEASREKDFEKMKEEKERIESKARELREKQAHERKKDKTTNERLSTSDSPRAPSVPVTTMKRLEEFYLKENSNLSPSEKNLARQWSIEVEELQSSPVPKETSQTTSSRKSRKRSKSENKKFKETSAAYNSLPRQPRRKANEPWNDNAIEINDRSSVHPMDKLNFYNRYKPSNAQLVQGDGPRALKGRSNIENFGSTSPENSARLPASLSPNDRSLANKRSSERSSSKTQTNIELFSRPDFMRREAASSAKRNTNVRHSIYTDKPSAFSHYSIPPSLDAPVTRKSDFNFGQSSADDSMLLPGRLEFDSNCSAESNQTASSSGLEVVERNQKSYYRIKQPPKMDEVYEKIEISVPCNL